MSFELGFLSFLLSFFTGLPAIVLGLQGLREVRRSDSKMRGRGLAATGVVCGFLGSAGGAALVAIAVQSIRDAADRMH